MRKLLTAGIFGTILSLTGANYADASIISRGFFDEAMENYATNTALDLKANQTDLTALSNKIGIDRWNTSNGDLAYDAFPFTSELFPEFHSSSEGWAGEGPDELPIMHYILANNASINVPGLAGVTNKLLNGWTSDGIGLRFEKYNQYNPGLEGMFNGWTIYDPSGSETRVYPGLENISSQIRSIESTYGGLAFILLNGTHNPISIKDYNFTGNVYPLWKLSQGIDQIGTLPSGEIRPSKGLEVLLPGTAMTTYPTSIGNFMTDIYTGYWSTSAIADAVYLGNEATGQKDPTLVVKGLRQITNEIGTLPDGITVQGMFGGWTDGTYTYPGLNNLSVDAMRFTSTYGKTVSSLLSQGLDKFTSQEYTGPIYPLWKLSQGIDQISEVPTGNLPPSPIYEQVFPLNGLPTRYPTSLYDLITVLFGDGKAYPGIINLFAGGFSTDGVLPFPQAGIIPAMNVATSAQFAADSIKVEIGTLPREIPNVDSTWARYGFVETTGTPIDLPDTIGGMFAMLFNEDGTYNGLSLRNIMARILLGYVLPSGARTEGLVPLTSAYNLTGDSPIVNAVNANTAAIEKIGTVPDGKNLAGMISETDAKIGTVPAGYDNVGAALTAMKSDIDAKNLPSTSDDGQYVLTAKKVGETITYTWVKMDLTTEEQGQ